MRILTSLAAGLAVTSSLALSQVTVGGLDPSRCRSLSSAGLFGYGELTTLLLGPSFASTAGFSIVLAPEVPQLTPAYLDGIDLLFLGDGLGALSLPEASAVSDWHASGGALFLVADRAITGLAASGLRAIGSPHGYGGSGCVNSQTNNPITMQSSVLTDGPFGDIRGLDASLSRTGELLAVAPDDVVGMCTAGGIAFAKHGAGEVNGPNSGAVFMTGDPSFVDFFLSFNSAAYSTVNGILARNAFAFLGTGTVDDMGSSYCTANPNSTGVSASMGAIGTRVTAHNNVLLRTTDLPTGAFAVFLVSSSQGFVANAGGSEGNLCLGGAIGRYVGPGQIQNAGAAGEVMLDLDLTTIPQPAGSVAVMPGDSFHWTSWYRDLGMGGNSTSNFANGITITFL